MVEKLIKVGHPKRYTKEIDHGVESRQAIGRITVSTAAPSESRPTINYILDSSSDNHY